MSSQEPLQSVELPRTVKEFRSKVKTSPESFAQDWLGSSLKLKGDEKQIVKYSGMALKIGRPLDRVMVVTAGLPGAGKSTTINVLFNEELCTTGTDRTKTVYVKEYSKELNVTEESPSIKGHLCFVSVTGVDNVGKSEETKNLSVVNKFRMDHMALAHRMVRSTNGFKIRESVYPNLVLMMVKAGDNRIEGKDSHFQKGLDALKKCQIIDPEGNNLLVVVTHAMNLQREERIYMQESEELTQRIQTVVADAVDIKGVRVIFVENKPEENDMVKDEDSDFYTLPDGQISHHNLIMAMADLFIQTDDYLGKLFCGWYLSSLCPDRSVILTTVDHDSLTEEGAGQDEAIHDDFSTEKGIEEAEDAIHDGSSTEEGIEEAEQTKATHYGFSTDEGLKKRREKGVTTDEALKKRSEEGVTALKFHYIGRGYDPTTETVKETVYCGDETQLTEIEGKKFIVPKCFQVAPNTETLFERLTCETKKQYVAKKLATYGLGANVNLIVNVASTGRWVKDSYSENGNAIVTMLHEMRLAYIQTDESEDNMNVKLNAELIHLPIPYDASNAFSYREFFTKWGTHVIWKIGVGGYVEVNCTTNKKSFRKEKFLKLEAEAKMLELPVGLGAEFQKYDRKFQLEFQEHSTVRLSGGKSLGMTPLKDLTPERIQHWGKSVKKAPNELIHHFNLKPYSSLLDPQEIRTHLLIATDEYLNGKLEKKIPRNKNRLSKDMTDSARNSFWRFKGYKVAWRQKH